MTFTRKTTLCVSLAFFSYVACEAFSFGLYAFWFGSFFSFGELESKRQSILTSVDNVDFKLPRSEHTAWPGSTFVLHPYLGWVRKPSAHPPAPHSPVSRHVTQLGFVADEDPLLVSPDPSKFILGITGGSVASDLYMSANGQAIFRRELEKLPALKGKKLVIAAFCTGGYKQPQQLLGVAYYLSIGGRLDALINLDGKNEATESVRIANKGSYPAYPLLWRNFFPDSFNPESLPQLGQLAMWRKVRRLAAKTFESLKYSVTASTVWGFLDHYLESQTVALTNALTPTETARPLPYFVTGPRYLRRVGPEDLTDSQVALWKTSSFQLEALARLNHFKYFHFLQPNQYVPGAKPLSSLEKTRFFDQTSLDALTVKEFFPRFETELVALRDQGVEAHSLARVFNETRETVYTDSCCHLNELGNGLLASAITAQLVNYYGGQSAPSN